MKLLKDISEKKILNIFTMCIFIFLPILKMISYYLEKYYIIRNFDSIDVSSVLYISIPFLIYTYVANIIKTKRKLDIIDYIFYFLLIGGLIASIFSIDVDIALFGKSNRHQGFFSYICYYLLFVNWKVYGNKDDIKRIIKTLVIIGIANSIYGLLQLYTDSPLIIRYGNGEHMAFGLCGNPNFFGTLIVTLLSIITTSFLINKRFCIKEFLLLILFFISLINCQSTGPFLAYFITLIFFVIYLFIKKSIYVKKLIYLIITLIVTFVGIFYINKARFGIEKCEMCNFVNMINIHIEDMISEKKEETNPNNIVLQTTQSSQPTQQKEYDERYDTNKDNKVDVYDYTIMTGRLETWKKTLDITKNNLITGVGFDNVYFEYYPHIDFKKVIFVFTNNNFVLTKYSIVDNPHNIYLNILVSTGLLGFIPYMLLLLLTFIKGIKTNDKLLLILFSGFIGYSVQGLGNIDVIPIVPIYYVIIGLMLSIKE